MNPIHGTVVFYMYALVRVTITFRPWATFGASPKPVRHDERVP